MANQRRVGATQASPRSMCADATAAKARATKASPPQVRRPPAYPRIAIAGSHCTINVPPRKMTRSPMRATSHPSAIDGIARCLAGA